LVTPLANAGVSLSAGRLRHVQASMAYGEAVTEYHPYSYNVGAGVATDRTDDKALTSPAACATDVPCLRAFGGHDEGMPWLSKNGTLSYQDAGQHVPTSLPAAGGTVVDASYRYTLVNGVDPAKQYVVLDGVTTDNGIAFTGSVTGAALWFRTLWRATKAGTLQATTLPVGRNDPAKDGPTVSTGSSCTATEVQATAKYLYWACGTTGPAGVYDLTRKANIALPAGQYLLGDNYVVRHEADGTLARYEFGNGKLGEPVTLATFNRGTLADDRNVSWAVDKFGGDVAWVDSRNAVHIVDPGVARSAPTATLASGVTEVSLPGTFTAYAYLTRPVDSTRLTITQVRTGAIVQNTAGGYGGAVASVAWNGLINGKRATKGSYRWVLSATAGGTPTQLVAGTFQVLCGGTPTLHSYQCNGLPTILGTTTSGSATWKFARTGATALSADFPDNFRGVTAFVPFGDISKDYRNDLLLRMSDGTLRAYIGNEGPPFSGNRFVVVPGNWNRYNAIVHTGDITGDGQSDLLARDIKTGHLYRYTGNGKGGFTGPVAFGGTYKGVTRFVGPGDINGDGRADLILIYGTTMYAWWGNGTGGFTPGLHLIGTGYAGFNAIIGAGDLNEDGKNDLVLRTSNGNLYRKLGNGQGGFGNVQLIGTGYQKYAGLY
jgi:hypothetical protein